MKSSAEILAAAPAVAKTFGWPLDYAQGFLAGSADRLENLPPPDFIAPDICPFARGYRKGYSITSNPGQN